MTSTLTASHPATDDMADDIAVLVYADLDSGDVLSALRWQLHEAVLAGARNVVVDLTGVQALSAAAVSSLLTTHRLCRIRGGRVFLAGCDRTVLELLHRTGLRFVFAASPEPAADLVTDGRPA
jgi:anti-anti-sigma factor